MLQVQQTPINEQIPGWFSTPTLIPSPFERSSNGLLNENRSTGAILPPARVEAPQGEESPWPYAIALLPPPQTPQKVKGLDLI